MNLLLNGASLPVGQLGPDFLLLRDSVEHPPAKATLVVRVEKTERRWAVRLPEGISATSRRVLIAKA
jgi:hypothetical protein